MVLIKISVSFQVEGHHSDVVTRLALSTSQEIAENTDLTPTSTQVDEAENTNHENNLLKRLRAKIHEKKQRHLPSKKKRITKRAALLVPTEGVDKRPQHHRRRSKFIPPPPPSPLQDLPPTGTTNN